MTIDENRTIVYVTLDAARRLAAAGIEESRRETNSLLAFVLQKTPVFLIAHPEYELTPKQYAEFNLAIERRANREPFHYITGTKEFFGFDFKVAAGVLIPRPETEIVVENAIEILAARSNPKFLELGAGSGCISVSILTNSENAHAIGVDVSETALSIAAENARRHGVEERLVLKLADLFEGTEDLFDLVVSNPPYIPNADLVTLQTEVAEFEPHIALFGGHDGLDIVRRIVAGAPKKLRPGGALLMEIGFDQAIAVRELFDPLIWNRVEFIRDFQGIDRVLRATVAN